MMVKFIRVTIRLEDGSEFHGWATDVSVEQSAAGLDPYRITLSGVGLRRIASDDPEAVPFFAALDAGRPLR